VVEGGKDDVPELNTGDAFAHLFSKARRMRVSLRAETHPASLRRAALKSENADQISQRSLTTSLLAV
jgi:hypothetical protein